MNANLDLKTLLQRYGPKQIGKPLDVDQQVCILRFSPDGKVLAAGGFFAQVRRWSVADTLTPLPTLAEHNGWVQRLAFHPDGKRLYAADSWGRLAFYASADKDAKPIWMLPQAHDGWIRQLAVSPDGQMIATCGRDQAVRLWSADKGAKLRELNDHKEDVFSLAFHPSGKALVSGDFKGIMKHWDLATGKCQRSLEAREMHFFERIQDVGGVRCLTFAAGGSLLVCGGSQPKSGGFVEATPLLVAFDWTTGQMKHTLKPGNERDGFVHDMSWHPDGFVMAVTSGQPGAGKLLFQRLEDAQPFFSAALANCHSLAVHPDGKRLVVAATNANSAGNGRNLGANKDYPGNFSPLSIWQMPSAAK